MSASLSPFALTPDVPMRTVSAAPVPLTEIVSRWDGDSPPNIRSISNSISDVPVPSAVAPGAKPPLARSIRAPWPPSAPVTAILSVFATVAVPHCTPSTSIWPPAVRAIVAASAAPVIVTEAVPELNVQATVALARAPPNRSQAKSARTSGAAPITPARAWFRI